MELNISLGCVSLNCFTCLQPEQSLFFSPVMLRDDQSELTDCSTMLPNTDNYLYFELQELELPLGLMKSRIRKQSRRIAAQQEVSEVFHSQWLWYLISQMNSGSQDSNGPVSNAYEQVVA